MTTAQFFHIDPNSYTSKPWTKVDGGGTSFNRNPYTRAVTNLRGQEDKFTTDNAGFTVYHSPAQEKLFTSETAVRDGYYKEVESLLRSRIPGIKKIVIFDHTIRRRVPDSPRQPVQQVHVDQTPRAAEIRVRRHVEDPAEAEELLKGRYQIINVWRPISHPASDFPLAVIDWRSTSPSDFVPVDLLYPLRTSDTDPNPNDDRGKEVPPPTHSDSDTTGYEVKGETLSVAANDAHRFYYLKDMTPEEVMLLKCFDSRGEGLKGGRMGTALRTPHTAFEDPDTPKEAKGRESIEVRCLVFYEDGA